jgi:hypothetical protein
MSVTSDKLTLVDSKLQRTGTESPADRLAGVSEPLLRWWRRMARSMGPGRKRRVQATLQRLAQADVEDTLSEVDVKSWLSVLESEAAPARNKRVARRPRSNKP